MNKKIVWYLAATGVMFAASIAAYWTKQDGAGTVQYVTAPVTYEDLEETVEAVGTIRAAELVSVGAQVTGQIKSMLVTLGDHVKKGQLIAEIDSQPQIYALHTAEAQLESAIATLHSAQASLEQARFALARERELFAHDAAAHADLEMAQATFDVDRANIDMDRAHVTEAQVNVDTAHVTLGYTRIIAPSDGEVVAVLAVEGQTVNANQMTPNLIKLARLDTVEVKARVSEADVIRIKPGLPAFFTILGDPGRRYATTLKTVEPAPDSILTDTTSPGTSGSSSNNSAVYYNALLDMPNTDGRLRISMTTQVSIVLSRVRHATVVPINALLGEARNGRAVVRVLGADRSVSMRQVRTGLQNDTLVQILEGLHFGERVVIGASEKRGAQDPIAFAGG